MKLKATSVNATGIAEIKAFLIKHHRHGPDHWSDDMLKAWARDAEFQLGEGNPASIEIRAAEAVGSAAIEYRISDEGLEWSEVWRAWQTESPQEAEVFLAPRGSTHEAVKALAIEALGVEPGVEIAVAHD